MLQNVKKFGAFFFLLIVIVVMGKGWHIAKDGFAITRIRPFYLISQPNEPPTNAAKQALSQTYKYLGRGRQCYAFASADGKYVLKLPRFDRFRVPFWLNAVPLREYRQTLSADKEKLHHFILNSFRIADEELKEETGILYLHLGESDYLQQKVTIVDRIGRKFSLSLDKAAFLLQEKKPLMMPLFFKCLEKKDREAAKKILDAFLVNLASRSHKGISNKDPTFFKNFGFDGKKVVQIDIGSFYRKNESAKASFQETVGKFQDSLQGIDPEILTWFKERSEEILEGC